MDVFKLVYKVCKWELECGVWRLKNIKNGLTYYKIVKSFVMYVMIPHKVIEDKLQTCTLFYTSLREARYEAEFRVDKYLKIVLILDK